MWPARIAKNKEHMASPKSAKMKTHPSSPTPKLSPEYKIQSTINPPELGCASNYTYVPLLALFFMA